LPRDFFFLIFHVHGFSSASESCIM
jgi:hypothetical protein